MINNIRTVVLSLLNKENRGYITPTEFNLYAQLAQQSLFEGYFHQYAKSIVKQNARHYHSEYSDIPKHIREVIDVFSKVENNVINSGDLKIINDPDFYRLIGFEYDGNEIEEISKLEILRLLKSSLVNPTLEYPVFTQREGKYKMYPIITDNTKINAIYIRTPKDPKWTYNQLGGNPIFNSSALDYQDFELPFSCYNELVIKILGYTGVEIREADVVQVSQGMELSNTNNEQL